MRVIEMLKEELGENCFVKESSGVTYLTVLDFEKNKKAKEGLIQFFDKYSDAVLDAKFFRSSNERKHELLDRMIVNLVFRNNDLILFNYGLNLKRSDYEFEYDTDELDIIFSGKEHYYHHGLSSKVCDGVPAECFLKLVIFSMNCFYSRYGTGGSTSTITTFPKMYDLVNTFGERKEYPSLKELELRAHFIRRCYVVDFMDKGETSVVVLQNGTFSFPDRVWTKNDHMFLEKLKNKRNKTKSELAVINRCGVNGNTDLIVLGSLPLNRMLYAKLCYFFAFTVKDFLWSFRNRKHLAKS